MNPSVFPSTLSPVYYPTGKPSKRASESQSNSSNSISLFGLTVVESVWIITVGAVVVALILAFIRRMCYSSRRQHNNVEIHSHDSNDSSNSNCSYHGTTTTTTTTNTSLSTPTTQLLLLQVLLLLVLLLLVLHLLVHSEFL